MIISISNIKGGVGKTTTAVNLATIASLQGIKTLLIDADIQKACKIFFQIQQINNNFYKTEYKDLYILEDRNPKNLSKNYDLIIIDLPAGMNKKIKNCINKSDLIIIPTTPSILALNTYNQLVNYEIKNARILLNNVEKKETHKKVVELILKLPKSQYFRSYIPKSEHIENMPFLQKNIFKIAPNSHITKAYKKILEEII
ncbi:ParA family protein [Caminibacter mediatlanticus TB-2]|uniref:ParA family protein n=1 Tax=Caminibacter mediatlanticus TB-2 TaxID=391592 RepID=A0ABX5V9W7_9BACT|nr:ParA family protein [Caminibacter mediatlanticus]QCT94774.1 ParA family protein [Caminibacter mediatlanticus TB-2]